MTAATPQPLGTLVDTRYKARLPAADEEVWNLNLDKIEPHSGRVLSKSMVRVSELGPSTYAFDRGTVLYSKLRPYLNKVVVADDHGVATTELVPLRCDETRLDAQYLAHFLRGPEFLRFATNVVAGAKMPRMVMGEFWKFLVPLPPLPEQRRIAAILDQADALRAKRREALAQLDSLTQSIFIELFGEPGRPSKGWLAKSLEAVALKINDCPHSTPIWTDAGFICLRTSNLTVGEWNWNDTRFVSEAAFQDRSKRGYIEPGDIVLSREGTVGVAAIVPTRMRLCMGQRLVQVRPDLTSVLPDYLLQHLLYVLSPSRIRQFMVGSTSQHLNVRELRALPIPVPPLTLQRDFGKTMTSIQALRGKHKSALAELDALFASLQHRAFAGQLS